MNDINETSHLDDKSIYKTPMGVLGRQQSIATADILIPTHNFHDNIMETLATKLTEGTDFTSRISGVRAGATLSHLSLKNSIGRNFLLNLDVDRNGIPITYQMNDGYSAYLVSAFVHKNHNNMVDYSDTMATVRTALDKLKGMGAQNFFDMPVFYKETSFKVPDRRLDTPEQMDAVALRAPIHSVGFQDIKILGAIKYALFNDEDAPRTLQDTLCSILSKNIPGAVVTPRTDGSIIVRRHEDVGALDALILSEKNRAEPLLTITCDGWNSGLSEETVPADMVILTLYDKNVSPASHALHDTVLETLQDAIGLRTEIIPTVQHNILKPATLELA